MKAGLYPALALFLSRSKSLHVSGSGQVESDSAPGCQAMLSFPSASCSGRELAKTTIGWDKAIYWNKSWVYSCTSKEKRRFYSLLPISKNYAATSWEMGLQRGIIVHKKCPLFLLLFLVFIPELPSYDIEYPLAFLLVKRINAVTSVPWIMWSLLKVPP